MNRTRYLKRIDIIGKDDDLVPTFLVVFDEELTCLKLFRVHTI
jgi:hypothetical protein